MKKHRQNKFLFIAPGRKFLQELERHTFNFLLYFFPFRIEFNLNTDFKAKNYRVFIYVHNYTMLKQGFEK